MRMRGWRAHQPSCASKARWAIMLMMFSPSVLGAGERPPACILYFVHVLVMFYCMHARCMHLDACVLYACMHLCVLYCSQRGYRVNLEPRFFAVGACGSEPYGRLTSWQPPLLRDARTTHEWRMRHCPPVFLRSRVVTRRSIGDRP